MTTRGSSVGNWQNNNPFGTSSWLTRKSTHCVALVLCSHTSRDGRLLYKLGGAAIVSDFQNADEDGQ